MISPTILYVLFILAFVVHDGEEIAVEHKWVMSHGDALCARFPMLRRMFNHLRRMSTKAFAIAVMEELAVLVAITIYALVGGPYAVELWSVAFMVFSIHLVVHVVQAIVIKGYVPGLVTSILLLPFSYLGMKGICQTFSISQLLSYGAIGVMIMVSNLAFAHWLGMKMAKS